MRKLVFNSLLCIGMALPPMAHAAEGVSLIEITVPICHATNLVRDLVNRVLLSGPPASHQALISLPADFFRIAAWNRSLAASLDTAFIAPGNPSLRVAAANVQGIKNSVHQLRSHIEAVDRDWINRNLAVWSTAEQVSLDKANFVNGELQVFLSRGTETINQAQASQISKDLRDQADKMKETGNNIRAALQTSPDAGQSAQLQLEQCSPE